MNNPNMNYQNFMTEFRQFAANPAQYMFNKYGIKGNPDEIISQMMKDGKISQDQYNQARSNAMFLQNNPMFRGFFK